MWYNFHKGIKAFLWLFVWLFINLMMRAHALIPSFVTRRFSLKELTFGSTLQIISAWLSENGTMVTFALGTGDFADEEL